MTKSNTSLHQESEADISKTRASLLKIRELLDWIAKMPTVGAPLRGARRRETRSELERYAVDWLAKNPPAKRTGSHLLMPKGYYQFVELEFELIEQVKALVAPRKHEPPRRR